MSQTHVCLLAHLVFSTKHRADLIMPEVEPDLFGYMSGILNNHESRALALGGTTNHVHILISLSKNYALSSVVRELKKASSLWLKSRGAGYRNFAWQDGYGAFSIGQSSVAAVRKYIANQKERHRRRTFEDELVMLLEKYDVKFDERYIWR